MKRNDEYKVKLLNRLRILAGRNRHDPQHCYPVGFINGHDSRPAIKRALYNLEGLVRDGNVKKIGEKFRLSDHEIVRATLLKSRKP